MRDLVLNKTNSVSGTVGTAGEEIFEENSRRSVLDVANMSSEWLFVIVGDSDDSCGLSVAPNTSNWWPDVSGKISLIANAGTVDYVATEGVG